MSDFRRYGDVMFQYPIHGLIKGCPRHNVRLNVSRVVPVYTSVFIKKNSVGYHRWMETGYVVSVPFQNDELELFAGYRREYIAVFYFDPP